VIFFLTSYYAWAQAADPEVAVEPERPVNLFLHLDKSVYSPLETIRFTGYVLNRNITLMQAQNTLYVALVDPVSKSVISKRRFLLQDGRSIGSLDLPDTIASGDYWLLGYTNALLETGNQPVFHQLVSVRTGMPPPFRITSTIFEAQGDSLRVRYRISTAKNEAPAGGKFTYTLYDEAGALCSGQQIIDSLGDVVVALGRKQDSGKCRELAVTISRDAFSNRLFFPLYTAPPSPEILPSKDVVTVKVIPDSTSYHQRSKVRLHIRVTTEDGRPVPGIFSLSVIQARRLGLSQPRTIAYYDRFPLSNPFPNDNLKKLSGPMPDYGYVLEDGHKVDRPVNLALMGSSFATFKTDSAGKFSLPWSPQVFPDGGPGYLTVTDKSPDRYKIMLYSRADSIDKQLAGIHYTINTPGYAALSDEEDPFHPASKTLKTALVKEKAPGLDYARGIYNSIHCDQDYVCTHHHGSSETPGILNCPYMSTNGICEVVKPKEGGRYVWVPKETQFEKHHGTLLITYHCAAPPIPAFIKVLDPILKEKTSPLTSTAEQGPSGSSLQSTVYWNHALSTDPNGELTITFYTNDLTGNFICSLQGVSSGGVVSGTTSYTVVSPTATLSNTYSQTASKVQ
jgi:hypothetical protein